MKQETISVVAFAALLPICGAFAAMPECLFSMQLCATDDVSNVVEVKADDMREFGESVSNGVRTLVWRGHKTAGDGFAVTATLTPDGAGGCEYALSYSGLAGGLAVSEIRFPVVTVRRSDSSAILYPLQTGMLRKPDWRKYKDGEKVVGFGPNLMGFRFAAVLDHALGGWYVDQRGDARMRPCRYSFIKRSDDGVEIAAHYFPTLDETRGGCGRLPFGGVIRPVRGGWFQAAKIYREWAKAQDWYVRAKGRKFEKLRPVALWMWNRGRSGEVMPSVERFVDETGLPAALDWYWWHEIPYDVKYPNFWPPREPVEDFRAAVARLHRKGVYVQTYTNGMLWDMDEPDWKDGGEREYLMFRNGSGDVTVFNVYLGHRMAIMCGEAPEFQRRIRDVERKIAGCGMDGLYMDMIGNCMRSCWNPAHKHSPGGGKTVAEGYRAFMNAVTADNPDVDISTEEEGESYIDVVDSLIVLYAGYERLGRGVAPEFEMLPVFQMLYHGCVAMYGSYSVVDGIMPWDEKWGKRPPIDEAKWAGRFPDQFALEFARGVVWGQQPTVHKLLPEHQTDPKWAAEWKFVKDTAAFYHANREYLFDGEMCESGRMECSTKPVDFFVRGCYTKEEKFRSVRQPAVPTILHSVWKAPDGRVAAVLVNWTREPQGYSFTTPEVSASGTLPPLSWKRISSLNADSSSEWTFAIDAKPAGVCEGRVTKNSVRTGSGSDFPCRDW